MAQHQPIQEASIESINDSTMRQQRNWSCNSNILPLATCRGKCVGNNDQNPERERVGEAYQHVIHRYPQKARIIRGLLLSDPKFRGICEDYRDAREAAEVWSHSSHGDAKLRSAEFQKISEELEVEIERFLK